jgi:anti-anti-sigma regulatory factor
MKTLQIKLAHHFSESVKFRQNVISIFDRIIKERPSELILDFEGIIFASRSFVDQLYILKQQFEKENVKIEFTNISENVNAFMEQVRNTRFNVKNHNNWLPVIDYNSFSELEDQLLAL